MARDETTEGTGGRAERTSDSPRKEETSGSRSKVARVVREYGLDGTGDELAASWTGRGGDRRSLRELAEYLNREVLRAAMEDADMSPLDGEVGNVYRLLTDEEVSAGSRTEAETTLRREGVDVERLRRDFVSHQAVHTYLTKYRDVEWESRGGERDRVEKTADTVQRLQSRLTAVSEQNLRKLRDGGLISLGEFDVLVDARVFCEDCGTQLGVVELLDEGECDCRD